MNQGSGSDNWEKWRFMLMLCFGLFFASSVIAGLMSGGVPELSGGNVAVVRVNGEIGGGSFYSSGVSPESVVELLKKAGEAPNIKAVILDINSGGGAAVASERIVQAVKRLNKSCVAIIRDVGASGAYWVASACEHVLASRYSITGSVGVLGSYLDFHGLLKRYNVSYERLVGGEYKDIGSEFKPLSEKERAILQGKIDELHAYFLEDIRQRRNLSKEALSEVSTGLFFTGSEALRLGLIDAIGSDDEAENYLKSRLNLSEIKRVELRQRGSFMEVLAGMFYRGALEMGRGIGLGLSASSKPQVQLK